MISIGLNEFSYGQSPLSVAPVVMPIVMPVGANSIQPAIASGAAASVVAVAPATPLNSQDVNAIAKNSVFRLSTLLPKAKSKALHGTAFVVDTSGLLLTNFHVVQTLLLSDQKLKLKLEVPGAADLEPRVLMVDVVNDLALIKVDHTFPRALPLMSLGKVSEGEVIYSMGFPANDQLTFAQGNYGGEKQMGFINVGFATLPLNHGMSGGPLLNSKAEVIGVNRAIISSAQNLSFFSTLEAAKGVLAKASDPARTLATSEPRWKKEAVEEIKSQEKATLANYNLESKRERVGGISFGIPLPNQRCGQSKANLNSEDSDSSGDSEFYMCQSASLVPLVGSSNGLDVATYALSYNVNSIVSLFSLPRVLESAFNKEKQEIRKKSLNRKLASNAGPSNGEMCSIKNVKSSTGVEINLSFCMLANSFYEGIFSTFVRAEIFESADKRISIVQFYKGMSSEATATMLEKFLDSIRLEKAI